RRVRIWRNGPHSGAVRARGCPGSDWRPLRNVAPRSCIRVQSSEAEDSYSHALRYISSAHRHSQRIQETCPERRSRRNEAGRYHRWLNKSEKGKPVAQSKNSQTKKDDKASWRHYNFTTAGPIDDYLYSMLHKRDPVLAEMEDYATEHKISIVGPAVARVLQQLAMMMN